MKLASVRALKQELFSASAPIAAAMASRTVTAFARSTKARRSLGSSGMRSLALGAVRVKGQYKLAIRQQASGPIISALCEEIAARAKNEVDIEYIGQTVAFASQKSPAFYQARRRPLRIGSSISDINSQFNSAGTLGCFVADRKSPFYLGMLSNNHVIAGENATKKGSALVQPGTLDGGTKKDDTVGELWKVIKLKKTGSNAVDAAVGAIYSDIDYDEDKIGTLGNLSGVGDAALLPQGAFVYKVGRTTGQTKGRIKAFDIDNVLVQYDAGVMRFDNQLEIEGTGNKPFSKSGDSGSLVVDSGRKAIGLLFAGGNQGGSNGKGLTFANPIETVLDDLDVDLVY